VLFLRFKEIWLTFYNEIMSDENIKEIIFNLHLDLGKNQGKCALFGGTLESNINFGTSTSKKQFSTWFI